jgi:P27 family predicted phage terminase small subunit
MPNRTVPTNLKVLKGTFRADRGARNEARPQAAIPPMPEHLNAEAKAEWERISQELFQVGLVTNVDRAALVAYCEAWAAYLEAGRKVAEQGTVVQAVNGNRIVNPYFRIQRQSLATMHKFIREFGLSPASRINPTPDSDKPGPNRWDGFRK